MNSLPFPSIQSRYSELAQEGVLWIPDLIAPDPTLILPALVVLTFLANIELSVSRYSGHTSKWQGRFINIFRVFSLALVSCDCQIFFALLVCVRIRGNIL